MADTITAQINSRKIVNRVFALVILLCTLGSIVFAILTVVCNYNLSKTDYSSYLSYSSSLTCNKVYASDSYKITNVVTLHNHTLERMVVDLVLTYEEPDGDLVTQTKSIDVSRDKTQDIYVYFYRATTVKLTNISFKIKNVSNYVTMYAHDIYPLLYDNYQLWTVGMVQQFLLLMAICLVLLTLTIILFVITRQMFIHNIKHTKWV